MSNASVLSTLMRQGERLIAAHASAASFPLVFWQKIGESRDAFDNRCVAVVAKYAGRVILAVQSGRRETPPPVGITPVELPPKCFTVLHRRSVTRYRYLDGGRASGKSTSAATVLVLDALTRRIRVLCCREIQKSIRESVYRLISDRIDALGLTRYFEVREHSITCLHTGAEFLFEGLYANVTKIKSLEGLTHVWVEQAESVSQRSLEVLVPTVRAPLSEIWFTSNPDDPLATVETYRDRTDALYAHTTFEDNPWFPEVLRPEMMYLQSVDDDAYRHVWLGAHRVASDAQIFRGKYAIEDFAAQAGWDGPYFGADWGFSKDPTTLVKVWIFHRTLYVEYEAYGIGVDIDKTPALFDQVPDARRHTIRADSARPETISYLRRNGYSSIDPVEKWTGSVEDGIAHLRQYERIVVHPRCIHAADEMRLYSYKTDRLTGDVLPDVIDKHNHIIDALRYALAPLIKACGPEALLAYYATQIKTPAPIVDRHGAVITSLSGVS